MTLRLLITAPAEQDISAAYRWWRDHRSIEQADRWYRGIQEAIAVLPTTATRHPQAPESDLHPSGLRQVHFGLGRRPTHRVVFAIDGDTESVVRVRHASQDALTRDDLV
jgi:plasmid stabilization system protein ParE